MMDRLDAAIVVILVLAVIGALIVVGSAKSDPCALPYSQACVDHRMAECQRTERYTREECILIVSGGGK